MHAGPNTADMKKTAINRERADRRRSVSRIVRAERERLTSTSGTRPAFDYELLLTYARNRLSAAYALPLLVAIVGATATIWIDAWQAIAWAAGRPRHPCRRPVGVPPFRQSADRRRSDRQMDGPLRRGGIRRRASAGRRSCSWRAHPPFAGQRPRGVPVRHHADRHIRWRRCSPRRFRRRPSPAACRSR